MFTRQSPIKHLVPLALFFLLGLVCAVLYLNHFGSLAIVRNGVGMAAFDRQVFQEYSHPEQSRSFEDLIATRKIFQIPEGTRCQVTKRDMASFCEGNNHPFQIKLLDGSRKGNVVWMCSNNIGMTMPWP
jgi:hypothetical protein